VTLIGQKNILREFLNMNLSIPLYSVGQNIQKIKKNLAIRITNNILAARIVGKVKLPTFAPET
jgi:hypothetical protein